MIKCEKCQDKLWLCENHPEVILIDGEFCSCGGAAQLCDCQPQKGYKIDIESPKYYNDEAFTGNKK